ncbi:MAG TPA: hypothetical protein VF079_09255 [Sphingomicrobium sp.]
MRSAAAVILAIVVLAGCSRAGEHEARRHGGEPPVTVANGTIPAATKAREPAAPSASLPEPKGPIDPKSVEAAGQVVQHYGALVETSRFLQAEKLWSDINAARAFATALDVKFKDVHLEIGSLGSTEGAAGSIYTEVPAAFYGKSEQGKALRMPVSVVLRRVNDVPGSTEQQRRWHIERIEWKGAA